MKACFSFAKEGVLRTPGNLFAVLLILLQFSSLHCAPVTQLENQAKKGSPLTIVFLSTCISSGPREIQIGSGYKGCTNVNLASVENVIQTNPQGVQLRLFEKENCDGQSIIFPSTTLDESTPSDSASSQEKPKKVSFPVSSFMLVNQS